MWKGVRPIGRPILPLWLPSLDVVDSSIPYFDLARVGSILPSDPEVDRLEPRANQFLCPDWRSRQDAARHGNAFLGH